MNVLAAILALQVQQLHHDFIGIACVYFALQENDTVFKQQVAEGQLSLTLVALVCVRVADLCQRISELGQPRIQRALLLAIQG